MFKEVHLDNIEQRAGAIQIPRLLAMWRELQTGDRLPPYEAFAPDRLPGFTANLAIVEVREPGDYEYVHYGQAIAAESGVDMLGSRVSEWKSEVGAFFCSAYDRCIVERRPVYTLHRANHAARAHLWERVVLPTVTGQGIVRLVVFNAPREYKAELLNAILDSSPDGILALRWVRDDRGNIVDALVLTINDAMARILSRPASVLLQGSLLETMPELQQSEAWDRCIRATQNHQLQQFEVSYNVAGELAWFNVRIVPLGDGVAISAADITGLKTSHRELGLRHEELEAANQLLQQQARKLRAAQKAATKARRQAEEAAKEAETARGRLLAAFDVVPEGLVLFDRDDRYLLWNRSYAQMYSQSSAALAVGAHFCDVLRAGLAQGQYPDADGREETWLAERIARHQACQSSQEQQLPNGRWVRIEERRTPDGGSIGARVDITELKRREEELRQQNTRFDVALNNMSEGLCFFDGSQRLIVCNKRYLEMYDLDPARVRPGISLREIIELRFAVGSCPAMAPEQYHAWRNSVAVSRQPSNTVVNLLNGKTFEIRHQPMPDGGWVATHADISDRRRMEERIVHMAHHDALTGLPNRALLLETLQQRLAMRPDGAEIAVISLDLDRFKEVNDTLGHAVGDLLLQAVAERLQNCVRQSDMVARLGGDEFTIVQAGPDAPRQAALVASRIIDALTSPIAVQDHRIVIGVSIGIALAPQDGTDMHQLLKNSDLALYGAKADGRGVYRFFEADMNARMQARRSLEMDLRDALEQHEFELHYQPVLELKSDKVCSCEALLRWHHPHRGNVSPSEFIPIAEATGLIVPLGNWVLRQACETATSWPQHIKVAVNLSPLQFRSPDLVRQVKDALAWSGLAAERLELEITETVLLGDVTRTLAVVTQLREVGVQIALDDFGTGYSSLSYLRNFPFDKIKIDRSFIVDLEQGDATSGAILRTVTELGRTLGMRTTAEGVETSAQLERVRAEGCSEVQGYFFSRPINAGQVREMLYEPGRRDQAA